MISRALLLAAACGVSALSHAAELQPPLAFSSPGVSTIPFASLAAANCPALPVPDGSTWAGRLVIRDTDRPDVGPYTVKLPGYATGSNRATDSYRPFVVAASPGDTLRFDVVNQLGQDETQGGVVNLHTHGLIVSPRPCVPLGDYIFTYDQPGTTTPYRIDIPRTIPGKMFGRGNRPTPYPSGLNWFHAHVHGKSSADVMAGQSGMLYIGDLKAELRAAPALPAATAAALDNTDVLYLGLRDIQLAVPAGATPDQAARGTRARWITADDYDSGACAKPTPKRFSGPGYCGHAGASIGGVTLPQQDTVWLFTINGQHEPTITLPPGRNQVWRVANLSASLTYLIELVDDQTGELQTLDMLALDGLIAGTRTPGGAAPGNLHVGVDLKHLLLMPASRAEIFIPNTAGRTARKLTLRTAGNLLGPAGDPWPRIDLGAVVMQPTPSAALASASVAAPASTLDITLATGISAAASLSADASPLTAAAPPNCVTLPQGMRRRVTFLENGDPPSGQPQPFDFGFKIEVVGAAGTPVGGSTTIGPQAFPMRAMLDPHSIRHVCPRLGTSEVWELENTTGEIHNFHIHQSKFRLSQSGDAGAPANFAPITDPSGVYFQYEPEAQHATPTEYVDVWHDVLPVPPAQLKRDGSPQAAGRLFVTIPFQAPQQAGDFVFHCHILEHEDGGMMAPVQVFDPSQLAALDSNLDFATLLQRSICRPGAKL